MLVDIFLPMKEIGCATLNIVSLRAIKQCTLTSKMVHAEAMFSWKTFQAKFEKMF